MNRDNRNITEAYLKSRLLKEQAEGDETEWGETNLETWEKEYSGGIKITPGEPKYPLKYFFTQRMNELYHENIRSLELPAKEEWRRKDLLSYRASHDIILREIVLKYGYRGIWVNNDDYANRKLEGDELFNYLYEKYFELKDETDRPWSYSDDEDADSGSHDDEGSDDDFDDTAHDDDPTGQDEPVDTRSYSDVRTSDRLDYANRRVRSGKWDRERAEEYKRGA